MSIAVSFFTATKRRETVFLNEDIFSLLTFLEPATTGAAASVGLLDAGTAAGWGAGAVFWAPNASSFVIRPSLPDPGTEAGAIPFSAKILEAAGDA